jgi:putative transposase
VARQVRRHGRFGRERLRELEGENAKLKKLLAEAHLDMHALKSVLGVER